MQLERNNLIYPDVDWVSTSGHDKRRLQNANGGRSGAVVWCTGEMRCVRNDPLRGGAKHSNARDCLRIEPWLCGGVTVPGAGTTFGNPTTKTKQNYISTHTLIQGKFLWNNCYYSLDFTSRRIGTIISFKTWANDSSQLLHDNEAYFKLNRTEQGQLIQIKYEPMIIYQCTPTLSPLIGAEITTNYENYSKSQLNMCNVAINTFVPL